MGADELAAEESKRKKAVIPDDDGSWLIVRSIGLDDDVVGGSKVGARVVQEMDAICNHEFDFFQNLLVMRCPASSAEHFVVAAEAGERGE